MEPPSGWDQVRARTGGEADAVLAAARQAARGWNGEVQAAADLVLYLESDPNPAAACRQFLAAPPALVLLLRLGFHSRYAFDWCCRRPGWFWELVQEGEHGQVWGRSLMHERVAAEIATVGDDGAGAALGRAKHRLWLRVLMGELAGLLRFEAVVAELSDAVDALAQCALDLARRRLAARLPGAWPAFAVLGMGKLGARELNYSSDIDLIFLYEPAEGEDADDQHRKAVKLGGELIRLLEDPGEGQVFRVDMRLRPEGDRGELVLSRSETLNYYWTAGRPWERQALIKARAIAGDQAIAERLFADLRPWVFPADPLWEDLEESRAMRRRIEERARERDLKTGAGGIRDIEFLAQHFQLAHGGRHAGLRGRATLPVLRTLADLGLLPRGEADELERCYLRLRTVEHRLQMWEDRQEHELPADDAARAALALRCGSAGLADFDAELAALRARVRELAERRYLALDRDDDARLALVVQGQADPLLAARVLEPQGFRDPVAAATDLRRLAEEPFFILSRGRTERSLLDILPALLHLMAQAPDPGQALRNFARIASSVGGRATFYELLKARPRVLALFGDLAGWANFLVDLLEATPGLPDELADAVNTQRPSLHVLVAEARQLVQGLEDPGQPLAFLVARETAAAAVHDLTGGLAPEMVGRRLAATATAVVQALLAAVLAERARRWGIPLIDGRPSRYCVLALGKLGGQELAYASDLDVLHVADPGGTCPRVDREGDAFWLHVAQKLAQAVGESRLYEIDARLRPWGEQGDLVTALPALARYWSEPRELWERMAMVRLAPLAGDPRLAAEALAAARDPALGAALPADAAAQVRDMRRRLEESVAGRDHVKRGPGGYVDIEFAVQYRCLGLDPAALPVGLSTLDALDHLAGLGRIPAEAVPEMRGALLFLRHVEARVRLAVGKAVSSIPTETAERRELARRCGFAELAAFDAELARQRVAARRWFDAVVR